ncbi:MAG: signal peptidase II [Acidimicrobiales bacterium]
MRTAVGQRRDGRRVVSGGAVTVGAGAVVVVADQLTKSWALHHTVVPRHVLWTLWLELTFNSGAAFGLGRGATPVVEAAVVVLVALLVLAARRNARRGTRVEGLALGLLVGGALSNLGDRLFRRLPGHPGAVVDWIDAAQVGRHEYWPVFNVADACVVVGAILLAWRLSRRPARSA